MVNENLNVAHKEVILRPVLILILVGKVNCFKISFDDDAQNQGKQRSRLSNILDELDNKFLLVEGIRTDGG